MAENPEKRLIFPGDPPDRGERYVVLPAPLPGAGEDFDWLIRDYEGFRNFMLEELMGRFPERTRWTSADMEVVIIELLATVLDQLSDMADRVAMEAALETARQPESVLKLLRMIGYNPLGEAARDDQEANRGLEKEWLENPHRMQAAVKQGPLAIHNQRRMVSRSDYADFVAEHPLVLRAQAWNRWSGSWTEVHIAVILWDDRTLDERVTYPDDLQIMVEKFYGDRMPTYKSITWEDQISIREFLDEYVQTQRMVGQDIIIKDIIPIGIILSVSLQLAANYYQSEVRVAAEQALGREPGGFFEPGRLRFGEDIHASDVIESLMSLDGVESVCLNCFKRVGPEYPDQSKSGVIVLTHLEIGVCDNNPEQLKRGFFKLRLHGGRVG